MVPSVVLAGAHHLLAFLLVATLAVELTLVRPDMTAWDVEPAPRIDAFYGLVFGLLLVAGFARVFAGETGPGYYLRNGVFWLKIGTLLVVAIPSLRPTMAFLRWRRARRPDAAFMPSSPEIMRLRHAMHAQAALLIVVPVLAALLARGLG